LWIRLPVRWALEPTALILRLVFFTFEMALISTVIQVGLALPMALTQLGQVAMLTTDLALLGHFGGTTVAAVALAHTLFFGAFVVGFGIISAVSPLAAQSFGARQPRMVRRAVRAGIWAAFLIGVPFTAALQWGNDVLLALGQQPMRWRDLPNPLALLPHQASTNDCPLLTIAPDATREETDLLAAAQKPIVGTGADSCIEAARSATWCKRFRGNTASAGPGPNTWGKELHNENVSFAIPFKQSFGSVRIYGRNLSKSPSDGSSRHESASNGNYGSGWLHPKLHPKRENK